MAPFPLLKFLCLFLFVCFLKPRESTMTGEQKEYCNFIYFYFVLF